VTLWRAARTDLLKSARLLLACRGIDEDAETLAGAMIEAEYFAMVRGALAP
jgi:hypothetical protein